MRHPTLYLIYMCALVALAACSSTSHLDDDELLYRGIKRLDYGAFPRRDAAQGDEGVISALVGAYNTVEGILSGDASVLKPDAATEAARADSLRRADQQDLLAYEETRDEVEAVLSYAPNGALMGSSYTTHPLPVRLWIYNRYVGSKHPFGRWMYRHFAAQPVYVSTVNPRVRSVVARNTLRSRGYFRGVVSYDTIALPNPRKAKLSYRVEPGPLFHVGNIDYQLFPPRPDSLIRASMWDTRLQRGMPFNVQRLDAERTRLSQQLREGGYYYFRPDYVSFRADTLAAPLSVQLQVRPAPTAPPQALRPYHVGATRINVYRSSSRQLTDTVVRRSLTYAYTADSRGREPLRLPAVARFLAYKRGDLYRQSMEELTTDFISSMGIFSSVRMSYAPRDTAFLSDTLDVTLNLTLDKPYDVEFQGNVGGKSNGQIGPGASFSFNRYNAFRGAETLGLKVWGSYEWQTGANLHGDRSLLNSYEYGVTASLSYPRILSMGLARRFFRRSIASTNFSLDAKWMNRAGYFGRVSWGGSVTWKLQKYRNVKHEFTPLGVDFDMLLNSTARFDSICRANEALYISMRDQFVPSMEYTLTWHSLTHHPRTLKVQAKEAGNVTSAIYALAGRSVREQGKELFGVPFAQYVKVSGQYTHRFPLTRRTSLATRAFVGAIYSFGNARVAPFSDLFSIGGANSIRAFAVRSIGPGAFHPATSGFSYIDQMGDLKLELNAEYRFPIVASLYGAVFVDAGNVWLMRTSGGQPGGQFRLSRLGNDIALGTGGGLRYDMDFLVLRVDVGIGLHAPYDTGRAGYYNMPSFFKSLGYHLAIGYPF